MALASAPASDKRRRTFVRRFRSPVVGCEIRGKIGLLDATAEHVGAREAELEDGLHRPDRSPGARILQPTGAAWEPVKVRRVADRIEGAADAAHRGPREMSSGARAPGG